MKLLIQNMVSLRCKMMVKSELDKLGIAYNSIELGEVNLIKPISDSMIETLRAALQESGLVLMFDKMQWSLKKLSILLLKWCIIPMSFPTLISRHF